MTPGQPRRPIPDDFIETRERLGSTALPKHYRASSRTIQRWARELNLAPKWVRPPPKERREVPEDFASRAPHMTKSALAGLYRTTSNVITRWLSEAGATPKPKPKEFKLNAWSSDIPPPKRETAHDLAADYLRRFMAVSRCDERGRYAQVGDYFRAGQAVLTFAELIDKADRYRRKYGDR